MQKPNLAIGDHAKYETISKYWNRDRFSNPTVTLSRTSFKRWQVTTRNCVRSNLYKSSFANETTAMLCVQAVLGANYQRVY